MSTYQHNDATSTQFWRERMQRAGLPGHMTDGLTHYILHGVKPGSFLCAVLCNDLKEAVVRADEVNRQRLLDYVHFLVQWTGPDIWGSKEAFETWHKRGGFAGLNKLVEATTPVQPGVTEKRSILRMRWHLITASDDYRPVKWPPPGPYWCVGNIDKLGFTIVTLFPEGTAVHDYWPELLGVEPDFVQHVQEGEQVFSGRFPCPHWWDATTWASKIETPTGGGRT